MVRLQKHKRIVFFYVTIFLFAGSIFAIQIMFHPITVNALHNPNIAGSTEPIGIEIIGETGPVIEPRIICSLENRIFIIWKEQSSFELHTTYGVYDLNETVYIQELYLDGSLKGDKAIIYKKTDFDFLDVTATKDVSIVADTENNLHILWYLMHTNSSSDQYDMLFYKKLNSSLETVIETEVLFTIPGNGYGSSPFSSSYIDDLVIDEFTKIHFLFDSKFYFMIDNEGNVLDYFDMYDTGIGNEHAGISDSMVIDGLNNTYIVSIDSYDYIYLSKFSYLNSNISHSFTKEISYNDTEFLLRSKIYLIQDKFYISWFQGQVTTIYYEFNSTGHLLEQVDLALRKGKLSNNQSLVYSFNFIGRAEFHEDKEFQYSLYDINNSLIHDSGPILIIADNPSTFYGPDVYNFQCIEDLDENLWLAWYVTDGGSGKQVMYWKLTQNGVSLRPVTSIAPNYHEYVFVVVPELPLISTILLLSLICISSFTTYISRRRKMKKHIAD